MAKSKTLIMVPNGKTDENGLLEFELHAFQGTNHLGYIIVNSGAPGHQNLTKAPGNNGRLEPIPEGRYKLTPLEWAGGKNNYSKLYPSIASPIWAGTNAKTADGVLRNIGLHLDGNRSYAPGTAGCIGFRNQAEMQRYVHFNDNYEGGDFTDLIVDHGLNSVKRPPDLKWPK